MGAHNHSKESCPDSRPCFGRSIADKTKCAILQKFNKKFYTQDGECPFCKPTRAVTRDKYYPFNTKCYNKTPCYGS